MRFFFGYLIGEIIGVAAGLVILELLRAAFTR